MVILEINPRKLFQKLNKKLERPINYLQDNQKRILRFSVGFVIGLQFWFWIDATLQIITFIGSTLAGISLMIILFFMKLLGVEEIATKLLTVLLEYVSTMSDVETTFNLLPAIGNTVVDVVELITDIVQILTRFGKAIFRNFVILFPILEDITIDIDWLHISLPQLIRTLFNVLQFFLVYYFYRKIKARLRERIKSEIKINKYIWFGEVKK